MSHARNCRTLALLAVIFAACESGGPDATLDEAMEAMGGEAVVLAVQSLTLEGEGDNYNLGQNPSPDADLPAFRVTEFRRTYDFANRRMRQEQTRTPAFVTANTNPQRQWIAVDSDVAFNVTATGNTVRAADAATRERQRELLMHPIGFLKAAELSEAALSPAADTTREGVQLTVGAETYTLYMDPATQLPASIATLTSHANLGDVVVENTFADWRATDGVQLPMRITTRVDRYTTAELRASSASLNPEVADLAASDSIRNAPAPAAPQINVATEEIAPGVWYLTGGSHHSVAIEFADHLMLVEAPQSEARTLAVITRARELRPEKPIRYLVNTHHHFDHSGGIRAAMAEGVAIITHAGNEAFYRDVAARPFTLAPDRLAGANVTPEIIAISERRTFQDATRTVEVLPLEGNAHSATMLIVHLPREQLLIEADVYSPPAPDAVNPPPAVFAPNLVENVDRNRLGVARIVPIHGRVVPYSALVSAARAVPRQ